MAATRTRKPVKASVKDGDGDGFKVGADGKDTVPVGRAAPKAKPAARGRAKPVDAAEIRDEIATLDADINAGRRHLASGKFTPEQAKSFRRDMTNLRARALRLRAKAAAAKVAVPARRIDADIPGRPRGPDGKFVSREKAQELRDANGGKDPAPVTKPTRKTPVRPKPVAEKPGKPTPKPKAQKSGAEPAKAERVKAFDGATDAAVEVHGRVLDVAAKRGKDVDRLVDEVRNSRVALSDLERKADLNPGDAKTAARLTVARQAHSELVAKRDAARDAYRDEVHAQILSDRPALVPLTADYVEGGGPVPDAVRKGHEFFVGLVGEGSPMDGQRVSVGVRQSGRANADKALKEVNLSAADGTGVTVHEFTHHVEFNDPKALESAMAFREKRRSESGESYRPINQIEEERNGVRGGYEDHVTGFDDKFFSAYCGRDYGSGATEILTMGAQRLYEDPVGFAKSDPEYFQFTLTTLQGTRRKL